MCLLAIMFMIANTSAQTRVIAHRGFWKTQGSAQNSITSLLKADSIGCYGSEFDVWLTKDNGLVVSHDGIIQGHKVEGINRVMVSEWRMRTLLKRASGNS